MKFALRLLLASLLTVVAVSSFAGSGPASGCKNLGSWLGYDQDGMAWWMTTADGQNASHGSLNLEVPGAVAYFPGAFAITELHGVWERIGGGTFAWTVVGFVYDAGGNTLALARVSGKATLSEDCNSEVISNTLLEVFAPNANVETDTPIDTLPFPDHEGYRVKLVTFDEP